MSKVQRVQHSFDRELAEKGLKRIHRVEMADSGQPVYREHIVDISSDTSVVKPWWKSTPKAKKPKGKQK